ncbi:MAG: class I SAM-dependent methyltransferase [Planctomycetota bacterium]
MKEPEGLNEPLLDLQDTFTTWCETELFSSEIREATALQNRYCDLHLEGLYSRLGLVEHLSEFRSASELCGALNFVETADIAMDSMLLRLGSRSDLIKTTHVDGETKFRATAEAPDRKEELRHTKNALFSLGEGFDASAEFIDFGAQNFEVALRDDPELMDRLLSGRERQFRELWFRATNVDPLQNIHGIMGARAFAELFRGGSVLEIGGGTGNGIRNVLRELRTQDSLSLIESYSFTDISLEFILQTRHEVLRQHPALRAKWHHLDINKSLEDQKQAADSLDCIYGVNAAHVARDIVEFLVQCRQALRPGGCVIFAERVRVNPTEMAPRELTLNGSIYHRTATTRAHYRPMHCYMAPENWLTVLKIAGFKNAVIFPDLEKLGLGFPDQYAAVIHGSI